ncbi:MAG: LacI family DNA-binding transcriptional regulator [Alphaproteobacteria bacterium]
MSKVTLRIIAEQTGLSKFAVSRALSGKQGVSEATRARVVEVATNLGYNRPTRSTFTIGAVFDVEDHANGEMNVQIQNGLQSEAARLGYTIRAHWTAGDGDLKKFLDGCDAIFSVNVQHKPSLAQIMNSAKPVVRSGWADPLEQVDLVGGTDREAGVAIGTYLYDLGHREIVFVHGDIDLRGRRERLLGLQEVVEATPGMTCYDISWGGTTTFTQGLDQVLAEGGHPTAFFCGHDGLAITAYSDILSRGWRIPRDVSVVGFGDFSPALQVTPTLTTVKIKAQEFGRAAVRRLDTRLRHPSQKLAPMRLLIPNVLIERGSTAPLTMDWRAPI